MSTKGTVHATNRVATTKPKPQKAAKSKGSSANAQVRASVSSSTKRVRRPRKQANAKAGKPGRRPNNTSAVSKQRPTSDLQKAPKQKVIYVMPDKDWDMTKDDWKVIVGAALVLFALGFLIGKLV